MDRTLELGWYSDEVRPLIGSYFRYKKIKENHHALVSYRIRTTSVRVHLASGLADGMCNANHVGDA